MSKGRQDGTTRGEVSGNQWMTTHVHRKQRAAALLEQAGVLGPPVPVEQLARVCGAIVRYVPFEGEISGMLFHEDRQSIIGVNALHSPTRQRFTIAHELGHLELHQQQKIHLDRNFRTLHRDQHSADASDAKEMEANDFAAELLMPAAWLERDLTGRTIDYEQDEELRSLADRYRVSLQAMIFRLVNLGILPAE